MIEYFDPHDPAVPRWTDAPIGEKLHGPFPQWDFPDLTTGLPGIRNEVFALTVVLVLAVLSWQMLNAVATSLYRQ